MPDVPQALAGYVDVRDNGLILHLPRRLFVRRGLLWFLIPVPVWGLAATAAWLLSQSAHSWVVTLLLVMAAAGTVMAWIIGGASIALASKLVLATRVGIDVPNRQIVAAQGPSPVPFDHITAVVVEQTSPSSGAWQVYARTRSGPPRVLLPQIPAREGPAAAELGAACAQLLDVALEAPVHEIQREA